MKKVIPGPCGICGAPRSVKETENYRCLSCNKTGPVVELWTKDYKAFGINGPFFPEAKKKSGFKRHSFAF